MIGYVLLVLILISVATGWIIARRAQGGEPSVQAVFYILGILILITVTLGLVHARDVRQHRKWMLRESSQFSELKKSYPHRFCLTQCIRLSQVWLPCSALLSLPAL